MMTWIPYMLKKFGFVLVFLAIFALPNLALAETASSPSKDSLRSIWEKTHREHPETKLFEKTAESGVYSYETAFFPYKGRLVALNFLIEKYDLTYEKIYFTGDEADNIAFVGIVETDLVGVSEDFIRKHSSSYRAWDRLNRYYFDKTTSTWIPEDMARDYFANLTPTVAPTPTACQDKNLSSYSDIIFSLLPFLLFLGLVVFFSRKKRRCVNRSMEISEEVLLLSRENSQVFRDILAELKKR